MECVEIVRHFVNTKKYVNNPGGWRDFEEEWGERRRERVFRTIKSCPQMVASGLSRSTVIISFSLLYFVL